VSEYSDAWIDIRHDTALNCMSGLVRAFQMRVMWQLHSELWCTPGRVRAISACPFRLRGCREGQIPPVNAYQPCRTRHRQMSRLVILQAWRCSYFCAPPLYATYDSSARTALHELRFLLSAPAAPPSRRADG
jgi:hypothetical protein